MPMSREEAEAVFNAKFAGLPVDPADLAAARAVVEEVKAEVVAYFKANPGR